MAPLLVRLNLPGFSSPEPFHLAVAPRSLAGLACAVLEEIGGLTREELQGVRDDPSRVPLSFLGEVAHSEQPVLLSSDAELGSFLATSAASLQGAPPTIEVRPPEPSVPPAAADVAPPSPFSHRAGTNGAGSAAACSGPEDGAAGFSPAARPATAEKARVPNGAAGTRPRDAQPPKRGAATRASSSGAAPAADPRASPGRAGGRGPAARASPAQAPPREGAAAPGGAGLRTPDPARHAPQQRAIARTSSSPSLGQRPGWEAAAGRPRHDLPAARWGAAAPAPEGARGAQGPQAAAAGQGQAARRPLERAAAAEGRPETSPPASAAVAAAPDVSGNSANSLGADRHAWVRLYYQDTEARRQRAEEAKRRAQEREEEEIRTSARRAMGRPEGRPSAGPRGDRGAGRDPDTTADLSRTSSPARQRSPLPQPGPPRAPAATEPAQPPARWQAPAARPPSAAGRAAARGATAQPRRPSPPARGPSPLRAARSTAAAAASAQGSAAASPAVSSVRHDAEAWNDTSGLAALGAGLQGHGRGGGRASSRAASGAGTPALEDSLCGEAEPMRLGIDIGVSGAEDDEEGLRRLLLAQRQRIEFLESMHQQALRQLRQSREEVALVQRQRFQEAERVLGLEQLISEMQAQHIQGEPPGDDGWKAWLQRSSDAFMSNGGV